MSSNESLGAVVGGRDRALEEMPVLIGGVVDQAIDAVRVAGRRTDQNAREQQERTES